MSLELPSLHAFQPKFYTGGPSRHYLPLFYDFVALHKPALIVTLGLGDGQAHFTFCQAVKENALAPKCIAVARLGEAVEHIERSERSYPEISTILSGTRSDLPQGIDLLLIDDCDSGSEVRAMLDELGPKLSPNAVVLVHGTQLERSDSPREAWSQWSEGRTVAEFTDGIGLGITNAEGALFGIENLAMLYRVAVARIDAQARADQLARDNAALQSQRVWLDSLFADRMEAQRVMDHQAEQIREGDDWQRGRAQAQLVMDAQAEQLRDWAERTERLVAEKEKFKAKVQEQKRIINAAKRACRKGGKCFHGLTPNESKERRSFGERVVRELRRMPRNLRNLVARPPALVPEEKPVAPAKDRYELWIDEHEASATRPTVSSIGESRPTISLLLPVLDPPEEFLEAMLASVATQSYDRWELCLVDAGSKKETRQQLETWAKREGRIKLERLAKNLGIAENTNRALALASGEFVACVDHDDLLAPFALAEIAHAIHAHPNAEIFYSDEDRLTSAGKRHSPFFKPEWSPELLLSSMYLGHLTVYRCDLVQQLGGWRKEYDLSQDYDLALRATDEPRVIVHVPHVLYHWREHAASGAAGGKPQARQTNLAALRDAMQRRKLDAEIVEYPASNRARLKLTNPPRVSIVIPTDSAARARRCTEHLPRMTSYSDYEVILVTNSALADSVEATLDGQSRVRCVRFDQPFNFSAKCNAGAAAATGERLIFFNDDVEAEQPDWIENVIEPLENPKVGAVSPKLLYESGKIQHAGLVTGVRGLVGTAFHQQPADTSEHWNLAQQMRDVSALSGACLAMRRNDFINLGGWDEKNTPIAGSDLDLCFKIREAGMRCIYTPFTTLRHAGHESIGASERRVEGAAPHDKSSIFLLERWGEYVTHDPYYTDNMRDWLYADSPELIRMSGRNQRVTRPSRQDLLFVSHDLSWSGAPLILLHVAQWCIAQGYFVTLMSPKDGPLREKFAAAGVPVIVDPLITTGHESFANFARNFDCMIASTIFSGPVINAAKKEGIPHLWWIHEGRIAEHYVATNRAIRRALTVADHIVTPDTRSARVYQPFTERVIRVLPYGIPEPKPTGSAAQVGAGLSFLMIGTIEQRKGQLVLLEALKQLPREQLSGAEFKIVGRAHESEIAQEIAQAAKGSAWLTLVDSAVSSQEAANMIAAADVIISASSDETGPFVLMEGAALGKALLSTNVGSVGELLRDEEEALFFRPGDATALASRIDRLLREPKLVRSLGAAARSAYEKHFTFDRFASAFAELVCEVSTR